MRIVRREFFIFIMTVSVFIAGCATMKPRRPEPKVDPQSQIAQLQAELAAKDQQIQELQARVETYEQALQSASYSGTPGGASYRGSSTGKSSVVRVPGVSVEDVQRALIRAGFDPGPVDGRAGKKTKAAIREFQRRSNLNADGIVGEKTWARLK